MLKQQKGMTLYALVMTIIAMLALAAIAIAMIFDELKYDPEPVQIHTEQQVENKETAVPEEIIPDVTSSPEVKESPETTVTPVTTSTGNIL